jgi:glycerol-3-phosphate acyltransferase PlsX
MAPDRLGGAVLLGVKGVVVVGHGASSAQGVASCVATAVQAVREGLVPRTAAALAELAGAPA